MPKSPALTPDELKHRAMLEYRLFIVGTPEGHPGGIEIVHDLLRKAGLKTNKERLTYIGEQQEPKKKFSEVEDEIFATLLEHTRVFIKEDGHDPAKRQLAAEHVTPCRL